MAEALSRRELLKRGALGGAGLILAPGGARVRRRAERGRRRGSSSSAPGSPASPAPTGSSSAAWLRGLRGEPGADRRAMLDRARVRRRPDRRARGGVHRLPPQADPGAGKAVRVRAHRSLRGRRTRAARASGSTAPAPSLRAAREPARVPAPAGGGGAPGRRLRLRRRHPRRARLRQLTVADWLDANCPGAAAARRARPCGRRWRASSASTRTGSARSTSSTSTSRTPPAPTSASTSAAATTRSCTRWPAQLPDGTIRLGAPLEALFERGDGSYGMRFGGVAAEVIADRVVLAIPFTTLRRVDLERRRAERQEAALHRRARDGHERQGADAVRAPAAGLRRLERLHGQRRARFSTRGRARSASPARARSSPPTSAAARAPAGLPASEPHAPTSSARCGATSTSLGQDGATGLGGSRRGFNGRAWTDRWVSDPWARGSYAAYLPGQYTRYYGYVGKPEGAIHFAGEHTATRQPGLPRGRGRIRRAGGRGDRAAV